MANYQLCKTCILEIVNNVKMATVICGTVKANYKVTGWQQQGLIWDYDQVYWSFDSIGPIPH